mgnify:CR=1 FL=1
MPAGLISLAVLPAFCICLLMYGSSIQIEKGIALPLFPDDVSEALHKSIEHEPVHFTYFKLNANKADNITTLDSCRLAIRALLASNSPDKGIRIVFNDDASNGALVHAIDICHSEHAKTFFFDHHELWILNPRPLQLKPVEEEIFPCGNGVIERENRAKKEEQRKLQKVKDHFGEVCRFLVMPLQIFLMMIILVLWRSAPVH